MGKSTTTRARPAAKWRGNRQKRYLPYSVVLEEGGSPGMVRTAIWTISAYICAFLVWAACAKVEEASNSFGEVLPSGSIQAVQHLEGGIVAEIMIKDGQIVEARQPLIRLEAAGTLPELDQMRVREAALELHAERLRAFAGERNPDFSAFARAYPNLVADQGVIIAMQVEARGSQRRVLEEQVAQRVAELQRLAKQEETLKNHVALVEEDLALREELVADQLVSKLEFLSAQQDLNKARGDLTALLGEMRQSRRALSESKSRLLELDAGLRSDALSEMGTVTAELAEVRETLAKLQDQVNRLVVRSPVRGIVKGLKLHTVGGVVAPGDVLLEIVPMDEELIVETRISPYDIGHVQVDQPARVKVIAYDFARYGAISGVLKSISASTFRDADGVPFYKGIIDLDKNHLGDDPDTIWYSPA